MTHPLLLIGSHIYLPLHFFSSMGSSSPYAKSRHPEPYQALWQHDGHLAHLIGAAIKFVAEILEALQRGGIECLIRAPAEGQCLQLSQAVEGTNIHELKASEGQMPARGNS